MKKDEAIASSFCTYTSLLFTIGFMEKPRVTVDFREEIFVAEGLPLDCLPVFPRPVISRWTDGLDPVEVGSKFTGLRITTRVVEDLAVVDPVFRISRFVQPAPLFLSQSLEPHAKSPHGLSV